MEELQKLQAQFMQVQMKKPTNKLSERVCIEILMKLKNTNRLEFYPTMNRKEYITPKQLENEIFDEILVSGGRINIIELQNILSVELYYIERHIQLLLEDRKELMEVNGELISDYYIEKIIKEIDETLELVGDLKLSDISKKFDLSTKFISKIIEEHLDKQKVELLNNNNDKNKLSEQMKLLYGCRLELPLLYTQNFISSHIDLIRSVFSAITIPTNLPTILSAYNFHPSLFHKLLEELINENKINGELQGNLYVPKIFSKSGQLAVEQFFSQNGYIEYDRLRKLQFSNGRGYLKKKYNKGVELESCFISETQLIQVNEAIDVALSNDEVIDIRSFVPSCFSDYDILVLIQSCSSIKNYINRSHNNNNNDNSNNSDIVNDENNKSVRVYYDSVPKTYNVYIVSPGFLQEMFVKYYNYYQDWAAKNVQEKSDLLRASTESLSLSSSSNSVDFDDDDDDDWSNKGKKSKKSKRRRKQKSKKNNNLRKSSTQERVDQQNYTNEDTNLLNDWYPDIDDEVKECIMNDFSNKLIEIRTECARALFINKQTKHEEEQKDAKTWQEQLIDLYNLIQIFNDGNDNLFENLSEDEENTKVKLSLERNLLRSLCTDCLNLLIKAQCDDNFVSIPDSGLQKAADRKKVLKKLPKKASDCLVTLSSTLTGKNSSPSSFLDTLYDISMDEFQVNLKPLDKKKRVILISNQANSFYTELQNENDPANAYHLIVVLLYTLLSKHIIHATGKSLSKLTEVLTTKYKLPDDIQSELITFGEHVVTYLTLKMKKTLNNDFDDASNALNEALPNLKAKTLKFYEQTQQSSKK